MKVTSIAVKDLFGVFNHTIPLSHRERVTIVHGPNGFGKTVILKMVSSLISGETSVFERVPFSEFSLKLDDGSAFIVTRSVEAKSAKTKGPSTVKYSRVDPNGQISYYDTLALPEDLSPKVLNAVDRLIPGSFERAGGGWRDSAGEFYNLSDILKKFPGAIEGIPRNLRTRRFDALLSQLPVFFVETKRLYAEEDPQILRQRDLIYYETSGRVVGTRHEQDAQLRVKQYSLDIAQKVKSTLADYAKNSQESDRTFPERLVQFVRSNQQPLPEREILVQMAQLENKRQRLVSLGFLDSESGLRDLTEDDVRRSGAALTIYVHDVQDKLKVFDDLAQSAGTLIDVINARFKYKSVTIRRDVGFRIVTDKDQSINLADLSSGEQHELVVLYELLFRAPRNGLVLVDEPEISLHVAWQSRFLEDLIKVLKLTDSYAIVATHSPVVIGTRWDLAVELKGPAEAGDAA